MSNCKQQKKLAMPSTKTLWDELGQAWEVATGQDDVVVTVNPSIQFVASVAGLIVLAFVFAKFIK